MTTTYNDIGGAMKHIGDIVATFLTVGTLMNMVPAILAVANLVYVLMRIYEWINNKRWRSNAGTKQDESE